MSDDNNFRLSVTYRAGHTQELAPSGEQLTGAQLYTATGAFLNDLINLRGEGVQRVVAEFVSPMRTIEGEVTAEIQLARDQAARLLALASRASGRDEDGLADALDAAHAAELEVIALLEGRS